MAPIKKYIYIYIFIYCAYKINYIRRNVLCSSKAKHIKNVDALNDSCLLNVRKEIGCYFIANLTAVKQYYTRGNTRENKRLQTFSRDPQHPAH